MDHRPVGMVPAGMGRRGRLAGALRPVRPRWLWPTLAVAAGAAAVAGVFVWVAPGAAQRVPEPEGRRLLARTAGATGVEMDRWRRAPGDGESGAAARASGPGGTGAASDGRGGEFAPSMVFKVPEQRGGWLDPVRRCHTRGAVRFCDGPRRVPKPYGPADRLADTLGLGTHRAGAELLRSPPRELWRDAVSRLGFELPEQLLWPVAGGNFGRGFGPRTTRSGKRKLHEGIDVGAEPGELIYAVADGLVGYADNSVRGYGNLLLIVHAEGAVSAYAHCKELLVFPGQTVERGQIVGKVGNTGLSRGPHLHFEWHERGRAVDPAHMFEVPSR